MGFIGRYFLGLCKSNMQEKEPTAARKDSGTVREVFQYPLGSKVTDQLILCHAMLPVM